MFHVVYETWVDQLLLKSPISSPRTPMGFFHPLLGRNPPRESGFLQKHKLRAQTWGLTSSPYRNLHHGAGLEVGKPPLKGSKSPVLQEEGVSAGERAALGMRTIWYQSGGRCQWVLKGKTHEKPRYKGVIFELCMVAEV